MEKKQQTVEEALWGYKDEHGQWTPGLVQRLSSLEMKLNLALVLVGLSLGRIAWPDLAKLLISAAQASGLPH